MKDYIDDKNLVIVATLILGVVSILLLPEAKEVVIAVVSGMFGIAVGESKKG